MMLGLRFQDDDRAFDALLSGFAAALGHALGGTGQPRSRHLLRGSIRRHGGRERRRTKGAGRHGGGSVGPPAGAVEPVLGRLREAVASLATEFGFEVSGVGPSGVR